MVNLQQTCCTIYLLEIKTFHLPSILPLYLLKHGLGYSPRLLHETGGSINHSQKQKQHQPLIVTAVQHRLSCLPIQEFPMLFNKDVNAYSGMRGVSVLSFASFNILQKVTSFFLYTNFRFYIIGRSSVSKTAVHR